VNQHPEVIAAVAGGDLTTIRSTKRRVRNCAFIAILTEEKELQTANRTHAELVERLEEMKKPSKILQMIMERTAKEQSTENLDLNEMRQDDLIDIEDRLGIDFDGENDTERAPEGVVIGTDGDDDNDDDESSLEVPWKEAAHTFMQLLLTYVPEKETITCPKCEADPFVDEKYRSKDYKRLNRVIRHLASKFHSMREDFIRRMHAESKKRDIGDYKCSYGCNTTWRDLKHLMEHIRDSSLDIAKWGQEHEDEKAADGWYDDKWDPPVDDEKAEAPTKRPIAVTVRFG
jgi:hypothetical protein